MTGSPADSVCPLEWGRAGEAFDGADESGDADIVVEFPGGALVGVIDGLGHGPGAALASRAAAEVMRAHSSEPVIDLVWRCHERLRMTRGAAMSLASFSLADSTVTWTGVGNVEGLLFRAGSRREAIATSGGVVGYQIPLVRARTVPVSHGDLLVMATDGIQSGFAAGISIRASPQDNADAILSRYRRGTDDALVLVAKYLGGLGD